MTNNKTAPRHVSIIMDGNGRWAEQKGRERTFGHAAGVESVRACVEAAAENGVKFLSLFAFSEENWSRPQQEVESLMMLMMKAMSAEVESLAQKNIRFRVLGNISRLSQELQDSIHESELKTMPKDGSEPLMTLIVFLSYSGKWDIMQACEKFAEEVASGKHPAESLTQEAFSQYLVTKDIPDPDMIIRTSGEMRISNYMLWQTAYSEFFSVEVLWPDFRKEQFVQVLEDYYKRDRRYGKVK